MCGDYDSVIGMKKEPAIAVLCVKCRQIVYPRLWEASICGVVVETDDATGLARSIQPLDGRASPGCSADFAL